MAEQRHQHRHQHHDRHQDRRPEEYGSEAEFWDARYGRSDRIWSGNPNSVLVREVEGLPAGRALDLGCGEGADAVWLARRGWRVTGTDISTVALARAAEHAAEAGLADRILFERHDLGESFPAGKYDLVSACFLHSPGAMPRERILRTAAAAVAPGGVLLVAGHGAAAPGTEDPHPELHFPTPQEVLADLELAEGDWEVLVCAEHPRVGHEADRPGPGYDNTLKVRRRA
ncbi:bifunctional 2-polyprenyl-6-hydroxyphenol methylase/3-demethylubiquinol 3-O-methyltransferase UbiG [Streptomyces sp. WAC06614]|uniref:class I SAM-dependent methyltransferase n=1 Tax=Streptomyces sp. WAC06614 TaxID=2487416 RepID=UPI000F76A1DB|nr:class I SAM-dependent methyltransferase [Streptomyces sp. WAC06614]RSS79329.1 class I SAM-dependent methyltransferase [Streptomyces sp. WAC06614]